MTDPKISICIPTYEMNGNGVYFLNRLLKSIAFQTFSSYEVIISDHSNNDLLEKLIESKNDSRLIYIKNDKDIGKSGQNLNNSIINSNTENIKIMFQDDFFCKNNALEVITNALEKNITWGAVGCLHYENKKYYRPYIPNWNNNMKIGVNTIGCPSVIFFKKENILFDDNLIWFLDTEFYWRMYNKNGLPHFINDCMIGIGTHESQITNTLITEELKNNELNYILSKN